MAKIIVKDGMDMEGKIQSFMRGDFIGVIKDHHDFGTEELLRPIFCCLYIPDMSIVEARSYNTTFLPDDTGRYIPRPSMYKLDIDAVLGADYLRVGAHQKSRTEIITRLSLRDPLLDPKFGA